MCDQVDMPGVAGNTTLLPAAGPSTRDGVRTRVLISMDASAAIPRVGRPHELVERPVARGAADVAAVGPRPRVGGVGDVRVDVLDRARQPGRGDAGVVARAPGAAG